MVNLAFPLGDYDEGVYIATVRSLTHHFPLYSKTYDSQGPLFFYLAEIVYRLSPTIQALRLIPVACSLIVIAVAYQLSRKYFGMPAAIFSGAYLAIDSYFLTTSRSFQLDIPWLAFTTVSFYFLLCSDETRRRKDVVLSAVFFALSLQIKLNPTFGIVIICHLLIRLVSEGPTAIKRFLYFVFLPLLFFLIAIPIHEWGAFYASNFRLHTSHLSTLSLSPWLQWPRRLLLSHERFLLLLDTAVFASGLAWVCRHKMRLATLLSKNIFLTLSLVWLFLTTVVFDFYNPLFPHHFVFFILPAVMVASSIVPRVYRAVSNRPLLKTAGVMLFGVVIAYSAWKETKITSVLYPAASPYYRTQLAVAQYLERHTAPNDYVITDDPLVLYLANRETPPELVDTSFVRLQSGGLTSAELIGLTQRYRPSAIALVSGHLFLRPEYIGYLKTNYGVANGLSGPTIYRKTDIKP